MLYFRNSTFVKYQVLFVSIFLFFLCQARDEIQNLKAAKADSLRDKVDNIRIFVIGNFRTQQFPQLGHGDVESYVETLAYRLHALREAQTVDDNLPKIHFVVVVPKQLNNPDNISYPFQSSIVYTNSNAKNSDGFHGEVARMIAAEPLKPTILWTFGDTATESVAPLGIPMISTVFNHASGGRPHTFLRKTVLWYRFFNDEAKNRLHNQYPWLDSSSVVIHNNANEAPNLILASQLLIFDKKPVQFHQGGRASLDLRTRKGVKAGTTLGRQEIVPTPLANIEPPTVYSSAPLASNQGVAKRSLVVGSMTTTPSRFLQFKGFFETINGLLAIEMLDRLYLNIPWSYGLRSKASNVTIPSEVMELMTKSQGKLRIVRCRDYGPSTKLLPLILLSSDELPSDTMIITFDDDRKYGPQVVKALVAEAQRRPKEVITIAAWPITILSSHGKRGKPGGPNFRSKLPTASEGVQYVRAGRVDLILGFYGVLYRKSFFSNPFQTELFDYEKTPEFMNHCAWVDDIWFSGHLERLNIGKYVIGNVDATRSDITDLSNVNALSLEKGESVKQNHDNVLCAEAMRKVFGIWG